MSEMTNQILFGESFKILKQTKKWSCVELKHDKYRGWIDNKQYMKIRELDNIFDVSNKKYCNIRINNQKQPLLMGSLIPKNKQLKKEL